MRRPEPEIHIKALQTVQEVVLRFEAENSGQSPTYLIMSYRFLRALENEVFEDYKRRENREDFSTSIMGIDILIRPGDDSLYVEAVCISKTAKVTV